MWRWEFSKLLMANMIKSFTIHDVRGEESREFSIFYLPPAAAENVPSINAAVSRSSGGGGGSGFRRCKSRKILCTRGRFAAKAPARLSINQNYF
jgi:hypothetical protein